MSIPTKYPAKKLEVDKYHKNVSQEVVEITTDRLRIILSAHIRGIEKGKDWQVALGVLLALAASLLTADFKNAFAVEAGVWKSLFILGSVASGIWLVVCLVRLFRRDNLDSLIKKITNEP